MQEPEPRRTEQIVPNPFDELTLEQQEIVDLAVRDTLPGWEINKDPIRLFVLTTVDAISPSLDALLEQFGFPLTGVPREEVGADQSDQVIIAVKSESQQFRIDRMAIVSLTEKSVVALG